jgi:hypothetical protein
MVKYRRDDLFHRPFVWGPVGYFFAFLFLALAVVAAILYHGTPHGGPTTVCGPIIFFNYTFNVDTDCRYMSVGELAAAFVFFFLSVVCVLGSRPKHG